MIRKRIGTIILVAVATVLAYFFLLPLLFMVLTSLKPLSESMSATGLLPRIWTLENYRKLLADVATAPVLSWLLNTAVITAVGTALVVVVDVLAAYALARLDMPGKNKMMAVLIWVMTIPGIVTLFPSFYLFKSLSLLDSFLPLVLPYSANVMGVYLVYNFLKGFPRELEEAAVVDGATLMQILIKVIFPSIKPVVATLSFITFLSIYNDYLWPSLVITSNEMRTVTVGVASLILGANFVNPGLMMAATVFAVLPAIVIFLIANKQVTQSVTNVGIK